MDGSPLSKFDNKDLWRAGELEKGRKGELAKGRVGELEKGRAGEKVLNNHASYHYSDFGIIGEPYYDMDFDDFFYLTDTGRRWDGWKVSIRDKVAQQEKWIEEGLVFHSTLDIIKAVNGLGDLETGKRGVGRVGERRVERVERREVRGEPKAKSQEQEGVGEQASWRAGEKEEEKGSGEQRVSSQEQKANNQKQSSVIGHPTSVFPSKIMFTMHPQRWHNQSIPWLKELVLQNVKNQVKRFLVKK